MTFSLTFRTAFILIFLLAILVTEARSGTVKRAVHSNGCPKNAVYKECTNICPDKSCDNIMTVSSCFSLRCGPPACACKEGHVFLSLENKNQGCVRRETCTKLDKIKKMPISV
uniref:TIL domain-containing protein n=1 Tax=Caenorhabditis japonica TaxID=281687 RepID=A0A8R1HKL9_CAEJA